MTRLLRILALVLIAAGCLGPARAEGLRPEVGKPLQAASDLLKAGKDRQALAKVREADAVSGKTAAEQLTIDRMKVAVAQRAGDFGTAVQALLALYARTGGAEQAQIAEQLAFAYSQLKDWDKATEWVDKAQQAGRNSAQLRQLEQYLRAQSGDYAAIARASAAAVAAAEQGGRAPDEGDLLRLADAQQRTDNTAGHFATLEKLVYYYPKEVYWEAYLARLPRKSGFSQRLALDVLRLRLASGTLDRAEEYMEMSQLAIQAGLPAEGLKIVESGMAAGVLGTGPEASRHQRLEDLASKRTQQQRQSIAADAAAAAAAADGSAAVNVGYAFVTLGEVAKGIALIEQGIAKGDLKRPEDAQLRLGIAQLQSPATKAKGVQTLRRIKGKDGVADIARLWTVLARNG